MPLTRAGLAGLAALGIAAIAAAPAGAKGGGGSGTAACGNGTVTWSPAVVWPPNHKLVPITISWNESEAGDSDTNTLYADSVTSVGVDDKGAGQPTAKQGPDYSGVPTSGSASDGSPASVTVYVRAERSGTDKAGRTYTINLRCDSGDDTEGNAMAVVTVPHDMGNHTGSSKKSKSRSTRTSSTSTSSSAAAPALTVTQLGAVTSVL
jgi:hypothetical protein